MITFDEEGDKGIVLIGEKPDKYSFNINSPFCHATIIDEKRRISDPKWLYSGERSKKM